MKVRDNSVSLDRTDWKILKALQNDSRETYSTLGRQLGISHSTVYDRVRRMEQYGVIERYTAIVNVERVNGKGMMAIVTLYVDPKEMENVAKRLAAMHEVLDVYTSLSEELLIISRVLISNQEDLHKLIADSLAPLPGVLRIRTSIISKKIKETQVREIAES